jgi:hypothetical protein
VTYFIQMQLKRISGSNVTKDRSSSIALNISSNGKSEFKFIQQKRTFVCLTIIISTQ